MSNFRGFDDQKNGSGIVGVLAGSLSGIGAYLGAEWGWWRLGWGPWEWAVPAGRSDTIHAYWLAIWGHVNPSYAGDFGTWFSFESWLRGRHLYDAFVASFWVPLIVSVIAGILVGVLVSGAINKKDTPFIRGGRFN
ncbi:MAG: hypothetical protein ACYCT9_12680 [Leptospirillum sp.]